jgi:3-phenylpropionate/trans-cinnamate dioxygenase ferredoxin reductase component
VRCGVAIASLARAADGRIDAVQLADGSRVACGALLIGVGAEANDALARAAGLACERGVIVDDQGRTSDPWIVAAGDCTVRRRPDGSMLRLESVQGATEGAKAAAATLLDQARPFTATPWFWSDQYDRKLQMAGLATGADRHVLRGSMMEASFSLWHFHGDALVAVDTVNASKDHLLARKLLDAGRSPTPAQVADTGFDLAALASG